MLPDRFIYPYKASKMVPVVADQGSKWTQSMQYSPQEFGPEVLEIISGAIPNSMRGRYYRNGPALFARNGERIAHWLDGDGAILGVYFNPSGVTGTYRYIQTDAYQEEDQARKYIFGSFGCTPSGPIWQQMVTPMKNVANTGLLVLGDRLLALWEMGLPYTLDGKTLETSGFAQNLGLKNGETYGALPKIDPDSGDIFNFGVNYGPFSTLNLYRSDRIGQLQQKSTIPLEEHPLIHDFCLAGDYLIFCIPPVRLNLLPFLTKRKSFSDSLRWKPEKKTEIVVIDRKTLQVVSRKKTNPWFQWRFGNGYVDQNGSVVMTVHRYTDFHSNQVFKEIGQGQVKTPIEVGLWQLRIDPTSGELLAEKQLLERGCESPMVDPRRLGKPFTKSYFTIRRKGIDTLYDLSGTIGCLDHESSRLTEAMIPKGCYGMLPVYVPHPEQEDQGWMIADIYDSDRHRSEIWIWDADALDQNPVCKLALPNVLPPALQGCWSAINTS